MFCLKIREEKLYQVFVSKYPYTLKLYTLKALLNKIGSIPFFSSSDMQKFHHLLRCHAIGINSSLIFF